MKRFSAFALAAMLCIGGISGCDGKEQSSSSETSSAVSESFNDWEMVCPAEGDEDYELGDYRVTPGGTKVYYEDEEYPREVMLALEEYFRCYERRDFEGYRNCIYPAYFDEMEKYLQENYGYGMDRSFDDQCDNLTVNGGEGWVVSRIKIEPDDGYDTMEEGADAFLDHLSYLGEDFGERVKGDVDKLYEMLFYIIAKDAEGVETVIVSEFRILIAEKDGKYYIFG